MCDNKNNLWEIKNKSDIRENGYVQYNSDGDFFQIVLTKSPVYYKAISHFIDLVKRVDNNEIVGVQINWLSDLLRIDQELREEEPTEDEKRQLNYILDKLKNS